MVTLIQFYFRSEGFDLKLNRTVKPVDWTPEKGYPPTPNTDSTVMPRRAAGLNTFLIKIHKFEFFRLNH